MRAGLCVRNLTKSTGDSRSKDLHMTNKNLPFVKRFADGFFVLKYRKHNSKSKGAELWLIFS